MSFSQSTPSCRLRLIRTSRPEPNRTEATRTLVPLDSIGNNQRMPRSTSSIVSLQVAATIGTASIYRRVTTVYTSRARSSEHSQFDDIPCGAMCALEK